MAISENSYIQYFIPNYHHIKITNGLYYSMIPAFDFLENLEFPTMNPGFLNPGFLNPAKITGKCWISW